ncbi:MAG: protein kinase [Deltaproteobacteria bacterium]|nr:protein kinase [Deltaproteobacteria bacterium]
MIGEMVGSYRILHKLGEGGMGVVYQAEHNVIGRRAAIKMLKPEASANKDTVDRFFNEARATARIKHSGLIDIFDFGHHSDGSAFIVMELLDGEPLVALLERDGRLGFAPMTDIMVQLCAAIGAAHAKGIVHRDLKPENVFLVPDDVKGGTRVKVLDFGIAKLAGDDAGSVKTRTGSMMGTPLYMSPEQCRGAGEVDWRSDIYAVGCMLYELSCGRPPFLGAGPGDVIVGHIATTPDPPSKYEQALPPELDALILRCLAKTPEGRPQSLAEVSEELLRIKAARAALFTSLTPSAAGPSFRQSMVAQRSSVAAGTGTGVAMGLGSTPGRDTSPAAARRQASAEGFAATTPSASGLPAGVGALASSGVKPMASTGAGVSTTLGTSMGQSVSPVATSPKRGKGGLIAGAALGVVAVGAGLFFLLGGTGKKKGAAGTEPDEPVAGAARDPGSSPGATGPAPSASAAAPTPSSLPGPAPATIELAIESTPPGADVFRVSDGVRVGKTPFKLSIAATKGELLLKFRLAGHQDQEAAAPTDHDGKVSLTLEPLVAATDPAAGPEDKAARDKRRRRGGKTGGGKTGGSTEKGDGTFDPFAN